MTGETLQPTSSVAARAGSTAPALRRLAARLGGLAGWRRLATAFGLGLLAAGALPPLYLLPLLLPAFTGLLWLLEGARRGRTALLDGWAFGAGYFAGGLYWVGIAMTVDLARFGWFMPVSVGGLSIGLGSFIAVATWAVSKSGRRGLSRLLLLAAVWLLAEVARGLLLSGFPWNLLGSVWSFAAAPLQAAALFGVWGLSVATLLAAGAPALLAEPEAGRRQKATALLLLALPFALWAGGALRLLLAPPVEEAVQPGVGLRLVQPSIRQDIKWDAELRQQHLISLLRLSFTPRSAPVTHIIWPETAVPYYLNREPEIAAAIARVVPPGGRLLVGAPAYEREGEGPQRYYNSLFVMDSEARLLARYDKAHLVPFGEYLPLRGLLSPLGLEKLAVGSSDFSAGPERVLLPVGGGAPPASPLICYEVIFPAAVTPEEGGASRPGWIVNLTNDAWFGRSSGPYQHLASARARAVEEGLPLVRAANNGISAVIDPYGRILGRLGLDAVGTLDLPLPRPLPPTPFARLGFFAIPLLLLPLLLGAFWPRRGGAPRRRH